MNTYRIFRKRFFILVAVICSALFFVAAFSASLFTTHANAQDIIVENEKFLPVTDLEYKALTAPIDAYSDQGVTAIAQESQTLLIYYNGKYVDEISGFTAIKQVLKLNDTSLLVSDGVSIYKINLENLDGDVSAVKTSIIDKTSNNNIGGNFFDLNDQYLVTAYSTIATVYAHDGKEFSSLGSVTIKDNVPIAINDNNEIFYVSSDGLYKLSTNSISLAYGVLVQPNVTPDRMIANNDYVFYIDNYEIFRVPVTGGEAQKLTVNDIDQKFELGKLSSPSGISFKGENLLISDSTLGTVQEFKIENDELVFTGFAIAKEKTAFNRVNGASPTADVEKYGNTVAVLDNYKLTVINTASTERYSRSNYKNYFSGTDGLLGEYMPDSFALGKDTVLLVYKTGTSDASIKLLNLNSGVASNVISISTSPVIRDVCYQSGTYYLLSDNGGTSTVYAISENDFSVDNDDIIYSTTDLTSIITVDTYRNIYLSNDTTVYCVEKVTTGEQAGSYLCTSIINGLTSVKKIAYDLSGGIYILDNGKIAYYINQTLSATYFINGEQITAFSMDYVDDKTFILTNGQEYLSISEDFDNLTLSDLTAPNEYVTRSDNADINDLKAYKAADGANTYIMEKTSEHFNFVELNDKIDEYLLICPITATNEHGASVTMYALAGSDHVAFIDIAQAVEIDLAPVAIPDGATAFTTTGVDGYYLPLFTRESKFQLINQENETVRIDKGVEFSPKYIFTYLGNEFYFATFTANGVTHTGYIPKSFTVEILSEDFAYNNYTIETINKTTLYSDQNLSVSVKELTDGTSVRVLENNGGVIKVAVKDGDEWIVGYLKASAIKNEPQRAIRNILIVLAVVACVCGTSTHFILRRKIKI